MVSVVRTRGNFASGNLEEVSNLAGSGNGELRQG